LGVESLVLESSDSLRVGGFALTIWKNAWKVLDVVGVGDILRHQHIQLHGWVENKLWILFRQQLCYLNMVLIVDTINIHKFFIILNTLSILDFWSGCYLVRWQKQQISYLKKTNIIRKEEKVTIFYLILK